MSKNFDFYNIGWKAHAEIVLSFLEKQGMGPPFSQKIFRENGYRDGRGNEWEKEK